MVTPGFGTRVAAAIANKGHLCAGIDPHPELLTRWALEDTPEGLKRFSLTALEAFGPFAAVVKPQSAFFERHGSAGVAVLEDLLAEARSAGILTLLDVKRGDIGSTMDAYADAYLGNGPLAVDAITVSPYLGFGSLRPAVDAAVENHRGVFVLCLTSNPEGASVQHATLDEVSIASSMARGAAAINADQVDGGQTLGPVGLVVGATVGSAAYRLGLDLESVQGPILAPGFGEQGAAAKDLVEVFGGARRNVLASSSRGLLNTGPDPKALRDAAAAASDAANRALG